MTDAHQFEAFVRSYQDMVYAVALRLLGNPAEAEDVAQSVFLKAFQRFDELRTSESAAGWLKTVTKNACLNHLARYRSRWRLFSEIGTVDAPYGEQLAAEGSTTLALEEEHRLEQLERAVQSLPDHQRVPLVLFHFEQASYQDIATLLGISLGKVKTDIHRGREALRRLLAADYESR
jgi:RNA polymerase sigma-70 factor (ECF subfamily)